MKRRNIVIPLIIFIIFIACSFLFSFLGRIGRYKVFVFNNKEYYLYQESNKEWFRLKEGEFVKKYGNKSHTLYVGNINKGYFNFKYFDDNLEMVNKATNIITRYTEENWFTYAGSSDVDYVSINQAGITSANEMMIFNFLEKKGLGKDYNFSYSDGYSLNIDNDIEKEYIYVISNFVDYNKSNVNKESDKLFSFMILIDGDDVHEISSNIVEQSNVSKMCLPSLGGVMKFNDDDSYKFINYCDYITKDVYKLDLYNYKNKKISLINVNS